MTKVAKYNIGDIIKYNIIGFKPIDLWAVFEVLEINATPEGVAPHSLSPKCYKLKSETGVISSTSANVTGAYTNSGVSSAVTTIDGTVWGEASGSAARKMTTTEGADLTSWGSLGSNLIPDTATITQVEVNATSANTNGADTYAYTMQLIAGNNSTITEPHLSRTLNGIE